MQMEKVNVNTIKWFDSSLSSSLNVFMNLNHRSREINRQHRHEEARKIRQQKAIVGVQTFISLLSE